jgi:NADH:quinone reductase (non-electrogenic)
MAARAANAARAPFRTRVTKMLGIQHPVVMGGLTGAGTPELAAAVSNAGGLGIFAVHNAGSPQNARQWIDRMKTLCPDKPWGVNLTILPTMGDPPPYGMDRWSVCVCCVP